MNSKTIITIGLLLSLLLMSLCLYLNAERLSRELGYVGDKRDIALDTEVASEKKDRESSQEEIALRNMKIDEIITQEVEELRVGEMEEDTVPPQREEKRESTDAVLDNSTVVGAQTLQRSSQEVVNPSDMLSDDIDFSYLIKDKRVFLSGKLPLLDDGDALKEIISRCSLKNECNNSVIFENNNSTNPIKWKNLLVSILNLFEEEKVEEGRVSFDNDVVNVEATFLNREAKERLTKLLQDNSNLPYTIKDKIIVNERKSEVDVPKSPTLHSRTAEEIEKSVRALLKTNHINFKKSSAEITTKSQKVLDNIIAQFPSKRGYLLTIQGHTDTGGARRVNFLLSQARADEVKEYFIDKGFRAEDIQAKGFGEMKLLFPKKPHSVLNRRVEIYVKRR